MQAVKPFAAKMKTIKTAGMSSLALEKNELQQAALLAEKYSHYGDGSDSGSSSDSD